MKSKFFWWWAGIGLGILFVSAWMIAAGGTSAGPFSVSFLDVGQGDATLIQYLGETQILVDGGPDRQRILSRLSERMPAFDRRIELLVLTHPDHDHLSGLLSVLEHFDVSMVVMSGTVSESMEYQLFQKVLVDKKIPFQSLGEGSIISVGKLLTMRVLHPDELFEGKNTNRSSLVTKIIFGEHSFLLTGDVDIAGEKDMVADKESLDADWLKISHHGAKTATSDLFLNHVTPEHAVISVGKNSYGHPTQEVLDRLAASHVETLRTDTMGTITVACGSLHGSCAVASSGK